MSGCSTTRSLHIGAFVALLVAASATASVKLPSVASDKEGYVGNRACATCHAQIYQKYSSTPMAKASGPATENLISADFNHGPSGVHYRIYQEAGRVWLSFERPDDALVRGKRELLYFIGSGRRGRSYLFATNGFLFESPVNWYANKSWDMAPAYQGTRKIPLNLPAFTSCLHCHVSGMRPPENGTENKYPMPVFSEDGVACERCHGPGAAHVAGGSIVNPAKLAPARRDEVCMQCHLEGKAAIERPGQHIYNYRPGDKLSDYIRYYVFRNTSGLGAVSQVEALAQSTCKKKSGDRMSCISCHDPHFSPSSQEKVAFYRGKCLACHGAKFGEQHHADRADCTECHMPNSSSTDVAHTQVTDHRIPRRPEIAPQLLHEMKAGPSKPQLEIFPPSSDSDVREFALAWQSLAQSGVVPADPEAQLLRSALKESPDDPALLGALGYAEQRSGAIESARQSYEKALALDPNSIDVATNLGVLEVRDRHVREALKLWRSAFQRAPGRSEIGMNIANVLCNAGQPEDARTYVLRVLDYDPDLRSAKQLLRGLDRTPPSCAP